MNIGPLATALAKQLVIDGLRWLLRTRPLKPKPKPKPMVWDDRDVKIALDAARNAGPDKRK